MVADYLHYRTDLLHIMFTGRWESVRSLTRYLQAGMGTLVLATIPEQVRVLCGQLAQLRTHLCLELLQNGELDTHASVFCTLGQEAAPR
jgi:hypothetical protein